MIEKFEVLKNYLKQKQKILPRNRNPLKNDPPVKKRTTVEYGIMNCVSAPTIPYFSN